MAATLDGKLVVAISSRAVFDFEEENLVFERDDDAAYMALQRDRLDVSAPPGVAGALVRKLLRFDPPERPESQRRIEVVVVSRNDPVSGLRVFRSARNAGLRLERGVFTRGRAPWRYLAPLKANLFLSANEDDVAAALAAGIPAARVFPSSVLASESHPDEIRIAFDGDAVLFSDESERVFRQAGIEAFHRHETEHASLPLPPGPFKPLLEALHRLQREDAPAESEAGAAWAGAGGPGAAAPGAGAPGAARAPVRIRTALVTARSAPAHERAIRTLMDWGIEVDEAMFLGGLEKGPFLHEFEPDFFFDDQTGHCESAARFGPAGHVPAGIANER
ncbi:MAG: 5'-nucleotidase [Burkholderiaceae bacterium]|nr:5'-nucleotidase [Burkholderiaceae bacterium]